MKTPTFSEPIEFWGVAAPVPDGLGGFTGTPTKLHGQLGTVKPLLSKRDGAGGLMTIKQQYAITFWNNPAYTPQVDHSVRWRGLSLTIQLVDFVDATRRQYKLTALQQ